MAKAGYGDLEVGAETSSVQAVHPAGTAAAPGLTFSADADTGIYRVGANEVGISASGVGQLSIVDGILQPITTNDIDLGTASLQFKDAFIDGTLEADAYTVAGTALSEYIADTVGAMVGSNTETNITVTYEDGDNTLDFVVASDLDTTGNAATATALATARNIGGVSFNGTGNIDLPGVNASGNQATSGLAATATLAATTTALASARNIGGVSFDGTGNIDLPGVNASGNQNTSGNAATVTTNANLTGNVTSSGNATTLVLNDLSAAAVAVAADSIAIIDADDSGSKKESIADFVSAIAGTNITASSGQLSVASATVFTRAPAFFMG